MIEMRVLVDPHLVSHDVLDEVVVPAAGKDETRVVDRGFATRRSKAEGREVLPAGTRELLQPTVGEGDVGRRQLEPCLDRGHWGHLFQEGANLFPHVRRRGPHRLGGLLLSPGSDPFSRLFGPRPSLPRQLRQDLDVVILRNVGLALVDDAIRDPRDSQRQRREETHWPYGTALHVWTRGRTGRRYVRTPPV